MNLKRSLSIMLLIIMIMSLTLSGCSDGSDKDNETTTGNENAEKPTEQNPGLEDFDVTPVAMSDDFEISLEDKALYNSLFDLNNKVKIEIDISEEELAKIQKDYDYYNSRHSKSPIYRKCNLTITINDKSYTIEEVGIRMKGNTSRRSFYDEEKGVYALVHFKLSFKQTFDNEEYYGEDAKVWASEEERKARKNRTFASLEGIEIKWNRDLDSTYTRETYAYKMYRDFGVLAPNNTLSQCVINGTNWGLYKLYEPVDEIFIERYLDKEDWGGDLYKCTWASGPANYTNVGNNAGVEDEHAGKFYTYDLKTNKKTSTHESLKNFVTKIKNSSITKEELSKILDIDNWLLFSSVSYFLGMPDDMRNNYNNHYIYFKKSTGQAVFIAYDCELCMGTADWNPTGNFMTETNPYSGWAYGANDGQKNKLIKTTLGENGLLKEQYKTALNAVADSKWMKFETYRAMYKISEKIYDAFDIPDLHLEKFDNEWMEMDLYDVYSAENKSNGNMSVDIYMTKMLQNYAKYK